MKKVFVTVVHNMESNTGGSHPVAAYSTEKEAKAAVARNKAAAEELKKIEDGLRGNVKFYWDRINHRSATRDGTYRFPAPSRWSSTGCYFYKDEEVAEAEKRLAAFEKSEEYAQLRARITDEEWYEAVPLRTEEVME